MTDKIVICVENGADREAAESLAKKIYAPLLEEPGEQLTVHFQKTGISLSGFGLSYRGDFEGMLRRVTNGRLQHEMLVRAAKTTGQPGRAVDATAGMGEDSFLLAAYGYEVTLYEQNPVIAALLGDAMRRAKKQEQLRKIVERMKFVEGDSIEQLSKGREEAELVYLDPMFPARQKSGLINKKLQLIQKLEAPCAEEETLFDAALHAATSKIVVKRPLKSAYLAGKKPNYVLNGKAIRYDCYACKSEKTVTE